LNELDAFRHFFQKLIEYPVVKMIAGIFIWLIHALFGTVFRPAYGIVGLLWLVDTVTGYYHAWANPAVIPESRRMYHGLVKVCIYYFLMFLGYQFASSGFEMVVMLQATIEIAIMLTEGKSILENLKKIAVLKKWPGTIVGLIDYLLGVFEGKIKRMGDGRDDQN
jgi:hypothetical protein